MSTAAWSVVGAILTVQGTVIAYLAVTLSRTRERLARLEQRADDRNHITGSGRG